jgi:hypothetical protein
MNKIVVLLLMMALHQAQAGLIAATLCATGCSVSYVACVLAITAPTGGVAALAAVAICQAAAGVCATGCAAALCVPTP